MTWKIVKRCECKAPQIPSLPVPVCSLCGKPWLFISADAEARALDLVLAAAREMARTSAYHSRAELLQAIEIVDWQSKRAAYVKNLANRKKAKHIHKRKGA